MAKKKDRIMDRIMESISISGDPALDSVIYGIPMPGITMHWLIGMRYWPLGRIIHLAGPEKSYKTSLSYEIGRWFLDYGGYFLYVHTEGRDNPAQRESILGNRDKVIVDYADTVEEWNKKVCSAVQAYAELSEEGPVPPMCIVVDSLVGTLSEESMNKIVKGGYAQKSYPTEAFLTTRFMQYVTKKINKLPISMIIINHLRPDLSAFDPHAKRTPGGSSIKYFEFIELWTDTVKIDKSGKVHLGLMVKNSTIGPPGRGISTMIVWDEENKAHWLWEYTGILWLRDPTRDRLHCRAIDLSKVSDSIKSVIGDIKFSPQHGTVTCPVLGLEKVSVDEFWQNLKESPMWDSLLYSIGVRTEGVELYDFHSEEAGEEGET